MKIQYFSIVFIPLMTLLPKQLIDGKNNINSMVDVFPIEPGIKYSYVIDRSGSSGDELYASGSRDSGQVDYVVVDSTNSNDSTIIWNIIELHDYWRTQASSYTHLDTTFRVTDSISLLLYEKRIGNHEVRCSGLVWHFPLTHIRSEKSESVFRYSNTTEYSTSWVWQNQWAIAAYGSGTDTILFSEKSGFYKRSFHEKWYSGYLWGNTTLSIYSLNDPITTVTQDDIIPHSISLEQNYPNPFNPSTTIIFHLNKSNYIRLEVFDLLGKKVETLKDGFLQLGEHIVRWNVDKLPSGVYYYRLSTQNYSETKKLILLK